MCLVGARGHDDVGHWQQARKAALDEAGKGHRARLCNLIADMASFALAGSCQGGRERLLACCRDRGGVPGAWGCRRQDLLPTDEGGSGSIVVVLVVHLAARDGLRVADNAPVDFHPVTRLQRGVKLY